MSYRNLQQSEIEQLQNNGCRARDWQSVMVHDNFSADFVHNVRFSGDIKIGAQSGVTGLVPGISMPRGIYNSHINNCTIADNVVIQNVKLLSNYNIGSNSVLDNIDELVTTGESAFGNGTEIEVLNEAGGRELKIFDKLSSHLAYMLVNYRHAPKFIEAANKIIDRYVDSVRASTGTIGQNVVIRNCKYIRNVAVGSYSKIQNALKLVNGTIKSAKEDPAQIGDAVIAENFIILSGSHVDSAAHLYNCFIGQGVQIGKQFSAENSAFFANSEGFHGEACSIFAGPYTVTHHKSTLLIAGMFSFYNAGSGTNQSNHMYKLGPVHQGLMERGAKTGSFSYMLWPSRVGAFSVVVGKHYSSFDTSEFPFSYIVESNSKSVISPAMNLFTVGTRRDSHKWSKRDRRKDPDVLDMIHFDLYNPAIVARVWDGMDVLQTLYDNTSKKQEYVVHKGIHIKRLMLKTCRNYYKMIINIFIGNKIAQAAEKLNQEFNYDKLKARLMATEAKFEKWADLSGLLTTASHIESFISGIENNTIKSIDDIQNELKLMYQKYDELALQWTVALLEKHLGKKISDVSRDDIAQILDLWKTDLLKLNKMILNDAHKEFDAKSMITFGPDGDEETKISDFKNVRGEFDSNSFVRELRKESEEVEKKCDELQKLL